MLLPPKQEHTDSSYVLSKDGKFLLVYWPDPYDDSDKGYVLVRSVAEASKMRESLARTLYEDGMTVLRLDVTKISELHIIQGWVEKEYTFTPDDDLPF